MLNVLSESFRRFIMRFLLSLGGILGYGFILNLPAQQMPLFSQYTFNEFLLNPAVAGSEGYTSINLTSRKQWTGIEGAPFTNAVSIQSRIMKRNYVETNASIRKRYLQPPRSGKA